MGSLVQFFLEKKKDERTKAVYSFSITKASMSLLILYGLSIVISATLKDEIVEMDVP